MSRFFSALTWSALAGAALPLQAQSAGATASAAAAPVAGERLSDWLVRQGTLPSSYPLGLQWLVPAEQPAQARLRANLLTELAQLQGIAPAARAQLTALIEALPVTGRVALPGSDARWLQARPDLDPVLQADHVLVLPARPATVSVITLEGRRCTVPHRSGAQVLHYLQVCGPATVDGVDRAWVVQADGTVSDVGIALWNAQSQDALAPGALVWVPPRHSAWAVRLAPALAQWLATQRYETVLAAAEPVPLHEAAQAGRPVRLARDGQITANDWGLIGLLQTPSARMAPAGEARFHFSHVHPYDRTNVFLQPFDALEVGFRYTNVLNRAYGPESLSGDQTYKDKSVDFKLRLFEEGPYRPQLALGITDVGGTGLFSSEYLVASKRFGDLDASLGMAWGYSGAGGNVTNPLASLDARFKTRGAGISTGGTPNTAAFFRGPAALFGGVQYATPGGAWVWKAEYDGNDYQSEPQGNIRRQTSPVNLGVVYRPSRSVDLSLGLERGRTLMLGLTLHTSVARMSAPKVSDPPTPDILDRRPVEDPKWVATAADVSAVSGWGVRKIVRQANTLRVFVDNTGGAHWDERIERAVAVLHRDAPAAVDMFDLVLVHQGAPMSERRIDRQAWVRARTQWLPPAARVAVVQAQAPKSSEPETSAPRQDEVLWARSVTRFGYGFVPSLQHNIGGPDGFLLFRAGVSVPVQWRFSEKTAVMGSLSLNLFDNFDRFKYTAPSNMPRVRTYLREYMTNSRINIPNLQITHFNQLADHQYVSVYAGYLETMFAGVGAEWLYRRWHSPWALGVDLNKVQQRNFDQFFGFNRAGTQTGYRVLTGHATAYWDTGWQSTHVRLSAGRYLAGDLGATLDLSKRFDNGVTMGAWATKTNVSAAVFGEGSFDKGLYLRIPFDVMTTTRSANAATLVYNPLTRDGGARLNRAFSLYGATTARSQTETGFAPAPGLAPRSRP